MVLSKNKSEENDETLNTIEDEVFLVNIFSKIFMIFCQFDLIFNLKDCANCSSKGSLKKTKEVHLVCKNCKKRFLNPDINDNPKPLKAQRVSKFLEFFFESLES